LSSPSTYTSTTRPLDALAASIVVVLCLSWGFNQVATKLAIHDIPPVTQAAVRSAVAALLISAWCRLRGIALLKRDGTLWFGIAAGILFAAEFVLIFQGLLYTTASRATLFIYLAPFFVVLGAHCAACRSF
jgi:drug/metabolite transporter (DMT)-like permease